MLDIVSLPLLTDNYAYLLRSSDKTAVVDPSEAAPVLKKLEELGWKLDFIWNTHHHADHVGGNLEIQTATGCQIVGAEKDRKRIPGITIGVKDGEDLVLGSATARVIENPGHTIGAISFWFAEDNAVFTGDTLFTAGCGRLFEGAPWMMYDSLQKLKALPDATRVFCGHEYTEANLRFAEKVFPFDKAIAARLKSKPRVPETMEVEKRTNIFLRARSVEEFADLRFQKDSAAS